MLINCPECKNEVSSAAVSCPQCGHPIAKAASLAEAAAKVSDARAKNKGTGCIYAVSLVIAAIIIIASLGPSKNSTSTIDSSPSPSAASAGAPPPAPPASEAKLELRASRCYTEYDYIISEGAVTNISNEPLKNVEAVAGYYDKDGGFITSSDAIIAYNPILPGQTSPFKTMHTGNPAIKRCDVNFKDLLGGTIESRQAEPLPKRHKKASTSSE